MDERICINCAHFRVDSAEPHYSELTPGSNWDMYCKRNHWTFDVYEDDTSDYRRKLLTAQSCLDFVAVED
jgi:hypothetical protein